MQVGHFSGIGARRLHIQRLPHRPQLRIIIERRLLIIELQINQTLQKLLLLLLRITAASGPEAAHASLQLRRQPA